MRSSTTSMWAWWKYGYRSYDDNLTGEALLASMSSMAMLSSLLKVSQTSSLMYNGVSGLGKQRRKLEESQTSLLDSLLLLDRDLTQWLSVCSHPVTQFARWLRVVCMCLEVSGHGLLWFGLCGILLLLYHVTSDPLHLTNSTNMFILLVADIVAVAPVKLFFKRPRPPANTGTILFSVTSIDGYAFPSGHASRCVALAGYFVYTLPFTPCTHLWYLWAMMVSLSRILIGRHHVTDVLAGAAAGLLVFETVRQLDCLWQL